MRGLVQYIFTATCLLAAVNGPVQVTGGPVDANEGVFRAIPFAAPPTGDLRWKPPAPVAPWNGVRKPHKAASDCMRPGAHGAEGSEDCLYLDVWPSSVHNSPVALLLPGPEGAAAIDASVLAKRGIVVVVANSRTGLMGYLAHPDLSAESETQTSGNYGLLDQMAALQWVSKNIVAFGGDPKNITVAGLAVPSKTPLAEAEKAGEAFALSQNAHSMRYLRPMDAGDLVQATVGEHFQPGLTGAPPPAIPGVNVLALPGNWAGLAAWADLFGR